MCSSAAWAGNGDLPKEQIERNIIHVIQVIMNGNPM